MHFLHVLILLNLSYRNIKSFVNIPDFISRKVSTRRSTLRYASAIQTGQELRPIFSLLCHILPINASLNLVNVCSFRFMQDPIVKT